MNGKVVPILAYLQDGTATETQAQNILINRCMEGFGYTAAQVPQVEPPSQPTDSMYRRYGVTSLAVAKRWGYQPEAGSPLLPNPNPAADPAMSSAEMLVYLGTDQTTLPRPSPSGAIPPGPTPPPVDGKAVPPGGCDGKANREIDGANLEDENNALQLANTINRDDFDASETNPTVLAVFHAWSVCMAGKGFTYSNPNQALDANFNHTLTAAPSQLEVDTATADVECKNQTHLVTTWFDVEVKLEDASIQKNILALTALKNEEEAVEKTALRVVSESEQG
ncbi:MAG: hypothetical protein WA938_09815, partial [Candidatus Dormiibacterota bacterium]